MKQVSRTVGFLLLCIFLIGIANYQFLRGTIIFSPDYLTELSAHQSEIVGSVLLSFLSGILSILVALLLFSYFKRNNLTAALSYVVFALINFIGITLENSAAIHLLEISNAAVAAGDTSTFQAVATVGYDFHKWAHYNFLWLSSLPVFVLFLNFYRFAAIPRWLAGFGMLAAALLLIDVTLVMLGSRLPIDLMLPLAIVQIILPFWLMIKGVNE